jgi:hypothetical protein
LAEIFFVATPADCIFPSLSDDTSRKLRPHADTATSELGGVVMVNDMPPGHGAFHCWPGSHLRTHPLWTTRFGNGKTKEQEAATREELAALESDTVPVECVGRAGDVVYWHPRLVHSPGINRSGTTADPTIRQAVICEWQRSGPDRTLISHPTSNPGPKFQFWIDTRHWEEDTDAPTPENIWDGWAFNCTAPLSAGRRG